MEIYIYALKDPETDIVRYIGRTTDYYKRESEHNNRKGNAPKDKWIEKLKKEGKEPFRVNLDICDETNCHIIERYYIKKYDTIENCLLNVNTIHKWGEEIKIMFLKAIYYKKRTRVKGKISYIVIVKFENGQYWKIQGSKNTASGYYYLYWSGQRFNIPKKCYLYKMEIEDLPLFDKSYKVKTDF